MARAPPPANRRKHRNCWAGWPTLFVDIIQLRPPRSSRFSKAGDSGCGYLGVLICYAAERIIPSHIPNLHLRRQKLIHQDRPTFLQPIIPKAAPPKSTSAHHIIHTSTVNHPNFSSTYSTTLDPANSSSSQLASEASAAALNPSQRNFSTSQAHYIFTKRYYFITIMCRFKLPYLLSPHPCP